MKKILFFLSIIALVSCEKEYNSIYNYVDTTDKASVKFVHAVPNALLNPTTQAGLQVYWGDQKVTGTSVGYGGSVFPGLEYAQIPAGNKTLKAIIPALGTTPEVTVVNTPVTFDAGKTYTAVFTDTLPTASVFLIQEDFKPVADSGKYFVRLINATPKSAVYDLYSVTDVATVAANVNYKTASPFVQVQVGTGSRTFAIRKPGTTVNIATVAITPVAGRMYSILSYGIDAGTGARAPKLTFFTSRFQTY
jgi:Domain of unknown function (DUF4397)